MSDNLADFLASEAQQTESYFRAALAREDLERLARLRKLAAETGDFDEFAGKALFVGWTAGDLRSKDLAEPLAPFSRALWSVEREGRDIDLLPLWQAFNAERMRILIHCL